MASDTDDARRSRIVMSRLGIERRHSVGTTALVVVFALVCGLYASWLLADFGLRWPALVVVAVVGGVFLYARPTRARVLATGLYALAVFLVLTPVALDLAFVLAADAYGVATPWPFVLSLADLVFLAVFAAFALLLTGIGFLVTRRANTEDGSTGDGAVRDD